MTIASQEKFRQHFWGHKGFREEEKKGHQLDAGEAGHAGVEVKAMSHVTASRLIKGLI